jgi:hypothetical protein
MPAKERGPRLTSQGIHVPIARPDKQHPVWTDDWHSCNGVQGVEPPQSCDDSTCSEAKTKHCTRGAGADVKHLSRTGGPCCLCRDDDREDRRIHA